jgi:hypothetical protein
MRLDGRLTWAKQIRTKRKQLSLKAKQMHWLLGRSILSIESKLLLYKAVLKPILTYGIQLWRTAFNSNTEIHQGFQYKTLQSILNAPWYIHTTGFMKMYKYTVLSKTKKWNTRYLRKLENHTTALAVDLLDNNETVHRLKRYTVLILPDLNKTPIQELK